MTTEPELDGEDYTEEPFRGSVPVDSGTLLIMDPCNLPREVLRQITTPNENGVSAAVVVSTPMGDGFYRVVGTPGALTIEDPYFDGSEYNGWGDALLEGLLGD